MYISAAGPAIISALFHSISGSLTNMAMTELIAVLMCMLQPPFSGLHKMTPPCATQLLLSGS